MKGVLDEESGEGFDNKWERRNEIPDEDFDDEGDERIIKNRERKRKHINRGRGLFGI